MDYNSSLSTDEEDYEGILKPALEVKLSNDFNPNSTPRDGYEFLQHVIYERKKCKKLVTSNINPEVYQKNQTISIPLEKPLIRLTEFIPSKEWQSKKLRNFQDFWCYLHSVMGDHQHVTDINEESFMSNIETEQPVFSKLSLVAQSAKIKMLELLTKYINKVKSTEDFNDNVGLWIFAILGSLDIPLSPSDCFIMREFCKKCLYIRSTLVPKEDKSCINVLNFFICIVGRFYNQYDLAD